MRFALRSHVTILGTVTRAPSIGLQVNESKGLTLRLALRFVPCARRAAGLPPRPRRQFYRLGGEQTDPPSVQDRVSVYQVWAGIFDVGDILLRGQKQKT